MAKRVWVIGLVMCLSALLCLGGCSLTDKETGADDTQSITDALNSAPINATTYFKTIQSVLLDINVVDEASNPIYPAYVFITEKYSGDQLFAGRTDTNGNISGGMTVVLANGTLEITTIAQGYTTSKQDLVVVNGGTTVNVHVAMDTGIATAFVPIIWDEDQDGDDVPDVFDFYPNNPDLAFKIIFPSHLIAVEDLYPQDVNDWDMNDLVVHNSMFLCTDATNKVRRIAGNCFLKARGANVNYTSDFYIRFTLPDGGLRHLNVGEEKPNGATRSVDQDLVTGPDGTSIVPLFMTTTEGFDTAPKSFINTIAGEYDAGGSAWFEVLLADGYAFNAGDFWGQYDPFLVVNNPVDAATYEIHAPFYQGDVLPNSNPAVAPYNTFIDNNGFPYLQTFPASWKWPLERVSIAEAYPEFIGWVSSGYTANLDWYLNPDLNKVYE